MKSGVNSPVDFMETCARPNFPFHKICFIFVVVTKQAQTGLFYEHKRICNSMKYNTCCKPPETTRDSGDA